MVIDEPRLGVDIGRVIIAGSSPDGGDTDFFSGGLGEVLRTPEVPGVFEALATLTERFDGLVWLVSKCGAQTEARSLAWLDHHAFYRRTGISADNVRFCRRRADKAPICAELGISHFIDDRVEVLEVMRGVVPYLYLFATPPEDAGWLIPVEDWAAGVRLVVPDGVRG